MTEKFAFTSDAYLQARFRNETVDAQKLDLNSVFKHGKSLQATRGAHNPNLQVVITHGSDVCSQHSFGLPLRMNGMHITQFDHARLDLRSLVI